MGGMGRGREVVCWLNLSPFSQHSLTPAYFGGGGNHFFSGRR